MASNDTSFLEGSEWQHVLNAYGRPGVAQACLLLQDTLGVDVLVLLHLAYVCGQNDLSLSEGQIDAADAVVRDWRNQVVQPLRSARRAIAKEDPATHVLRANIQKAELVAEQHALAQLAAMPVWFGERQHADTRPPISLVAAFYAHRGSCTDKLQAPDIAQAVHLLERELLRTKS